MDWPIEIETFLRLTGTTPGVHGLHRIDIDGVKAADFVGEAMDSSPIGLTTEEATALLVLIRESKLVFPTTASELIAWVDRQAGDFVLPDWFIAAAEARNLSDVHIILTQAEASLKSRPWATDIELGPTGVNRSDHREVGSDAISELEAIATLRCTLPALNKKVPRHRVDAIAEEIARAVERLPDEPSAEAVMLELRQRAADPGSCITEVAKDGVVWRNGAGGSSKLTLRLLRGRLTYVPSKPARQ